MTRRVRPRRWAAAWLAAIVAAAISVPAAITEGYAAVPKLEQIRVALFLSSGTTYNVTVPAVTLSSPNGLDIGRRTASGFTQWSAVAPGAQARFSVDSYQVFLLETADQATAKLLQQALGATQDKPYVYQSVKLGKTVYQLYAGMYGSKEEANAAKQRIAVNASAAALLKGAAATVTGPLHWNAGDFASEAEAAGQASALRQQGLDAWPVVLETAGASSYAVWIGEAADAEQLNAVKAQAAKISPNLALKPVDPAAPYLLKRDEWTGTAVIPHYSFNPETQKLWVAPKDGTAAIAEKSGRQYRGALELSRHNGKLAVVNELPFEQYLVSVVGGELGESWPAEALKAQAVSARTFALSLGTKYQIAHVSDSSNDQVYYGVQQEGPNGTAAVAATAGEVIVSNGELIMPYFYSNGGGLTGDPVEVWGQPIPYIKSVQSPDEAAEKNKMLWHRVSLPGGKVGYIREDLVKESGERNGAGLPVVTVQSADVNVRSAPYVDDVRNGPIAKVSTGAKLVSLGKAPESNAYSWIRGPYTADELLKQLNGVLTKPVAGKLETLEVSKRGPSGRVTELKANGQPIPVAKPDQYRSALFSAPSTRFDIEETGRYTVSGAGGTTRTVQGSAGTLYALGANGASTPLTGPNRIVLGAEGNVRVATKDTMFRLTGTGYGHGLGMSQWGALSLAESGHDYKSILMHYYNGITITKE